MVYLHNTDVPLIPLPRYYCFGHYPPLFYPLQIRFLENLEQEKRVKILETGQPKRLCFRISISSLAVRTKKGSRGTFDKQYSSRMVNGFLYSTFHGCIIFFVLIRSTSTNGCPNFCCISILAQYATKVSLFQVLPSSSILSLLLSVSSVFSLLSPASSVFSSFFLSEDTCNDQNVAMKT